MTPRFQITKVDESLHQVGGILSAEIPDKDNECLDYLASKPYFQKWSAEAQKATAALGEDKMSFGNVREQHSRTAVGKFIDLQFDDAKKTIYGVAQIYNDDAWEKVANGVYTGFSVGGDLIGSPRFDAAKGVKFITIAPKETSIVDNPCLEASHFDFVRASGAMEVRKFAVAKTDEILTLSSDTTKVRVDDVPTDKVVESTEPDTSEKGVTNMFDKLSEVEKAAHKTLKAHLEGVKKSATEHCKAQHDACDEAMKAMGFEPDTESPGLGGPVIEKTVNVEPTDITKLVTALTDAIKAAKPVDSVVGDPNDLKPVEKTAVEKAAEAKAQHDNLVGLLHKGQKGDLTALAEVFKQTTKRVAREKVLMA
jgi:hypothetical protein